MAEQLMATKLLRVLQERQIRRVGENQFRPVNCRIISATHKDLTTELKEQRFREDLFYRLDVIPIHIPPLRERKEDILPLAEAFLRRFLPANGSGTRTFAEDVIQYMLENKWRGNVRELENTIERACVLCNSETITMEEIIPLCAGNGLDIGHGKTQFDENVFTVECSEELLPLDDVIHKYIEFAVNKNGGARDRTAKELGIDRKTLYKRLKMDHPHMAAV